GNKVLEIGDILYVDNNKGEKNEKFRGDLIFKIIPMINYKELVTVERRLPTKKVLAMITTAPSVTRPPRNKFIVDTFHSAMAQRLDSSESKDINIEECEGKLVYGTVIELPVEARMTHSYWLPKGFPLTSHAVHEVSMHCGHYITNITLIMN